MQPNLKAKHYVVDASNMVLSWNIALSEKFIIRRNPLDLSRAWVLDPKSKQYIEIPYRILTLWEHKQAIVHLSAKGLSQIDETKLFSMIRNYYISTVNNT